MTWQIAFQSDTQLVLSSDSGGFIFLNLPAQPQAFAAPTPEAKAPAHPPAPQAPAPPHR